MKFRSLLAAVAVMMLASCGSSDPAQPSPVLEDPIVSCPADISVTAHNGQHPTVTFDTPTASKGQPPVTVICTPASGSVFPDGGTTVGCEATDARAHKGRCNFQVIVTTIPLLVKTKFLAFGDSLTEGKTRLRPGIIQVPGGIFNAAGSYPEILNAKLSARYQDQSITMIAYGWGGELAGDGKNRLQNHWGEFNPDAVLLMEGTNDLTDPSTATPAGMTAAINSVVDALRTDIVFAKGRGARVFLGSILPMTPPNGANVIAGVTALNVRIKALAGEQGVAFVDLNAAVPTTMMSTVDGIHPKPGSEAYALMAEEWLKAIIITMEVS